MASKIKHLRSSVAGRAPTAGQMDEGQLALNTADGKLFMKKSDSSVREITKQIHDGDTSVSIDEIRRILTALNYFFNRLLF